MIIDATDLILGRLASYVAKKALEGETIDLVNCEKAIISGNKENIIAKYMERRARSSPRRSYPRIPERFVKRAIRGMLPYKKERGKKALKRIKCYQGIPKQFKNKKIETVEEAKKSRSLILKYITIKELCKQLGAKI